MIKQVALSVKSASPLQALALRHKSRVTVADCKELGSNAITLLLEIEGGNAEMMIRDAKALETVERVYWAKGNGDRSIALAVVKMPSFCRVAKNSGAFCISCPLNSKEEESTWRLFVKNSRELKEMFDLLESHKIRADVKEISNAVRSDVLTTRQREILLAAVKSGYFEFPRKKDLTELASELAIKPSTLSEILRRSEAKVMEQFLQITNNGATKNTQIQNG